MKTQKTQKILKKYKHEIREDLLEEFSDVTGVGDDEWVRGGGSDLADLYDILSVPYDKSKSEVIDDSLGSGREYTISEPSANLHKKASKEVQKPSITFPLVKPRDINKDCIYAYAYKEKIKALKLLGWFEEIIPVCDELEKFRGEYAIYAYKEKIEALKQLGRLEEVVETCNALICFITVLGIEDDEVYLSGDTQ